MSKQPRVSVDRSLKTISRCYIGAVLTMSILIGATYATMIVALDRHSLQQNISFLTSSQFIRFQQLANQTRALIKASAEDKTRSSFRVDQMMSDIRTSVAEIRRISTNLGALQAELQSNWLERFTARDEAGSVLRSDLDQRLGTFLDGAERIAALDTPGRRTLYAQSGPLDLAISADSIMIWQFGELIRVANDRSSIGIQNANWIFSALLLLIVTVLLLASLFIFTPLLENLQVEHRKTRAFEEKLTRIAHHDALTGLFNRSSFNQALADLYAAWRQSGPGFAALLIDLDHFKQVNDTYGHLAGDAVLMHVAAAMRDRLPAAAIGARLGGDEFAVLVPGAPDAEQLRAIAESTRAAIAMPLVFEGRTLEVSASIGGAILPLHAGDATGLIRAADLALYSAKSERNAVVIFDDQSMAPRLQQKRLALAAGRAAENHELEVFYQPMVTLPTGRHLGFEALVRWAHPQFGLLAPGSFIHLLDGPAAMLSLTAAVVGMVARDIRRWHDAGLTPGPVSINMPEAALLSPAGFDIFAAAIAKHGIGWRDFAIEIIEDVLLDHNVAKIVAAVERFRAAGVSVALDDFGTGFASLVHLRDFPFDEIKIDRSFVARIGRDRCSETIIRATLDMARALGKRCVAEGIETPEQRRFLAAAQCGIGQGYLFARPACFAEAGAALAAAMHDQDAALAS